MIKANTPLGNHKGRSNGRMLGAIMGGAFLVNLDVFILNIAIPSIRQDLHTNFASMELVVAGYAITYGSLLITGGRLGDIYGHQKTYLFGLVGFIATSILCGLAGNIILLIAARLLQGATAAMMMPQVFTLIRVSFPNDRARANAFAILGGILGLSTIVGQIAGGLFIGADLWGLGWRMVFFVNVPIGIIALLAGIFWIEETSLSEFTRIDLIGAGLSVVSLLFLLIGLGQGREAGWPWWALAMLLAAVALAATFLKHQTIKLERSQFPLIDLTIFRNDGFSGGIGLVMLLYSALPPFNLFFVIYLQDGVGLTALQAGSIFLFPATSFLIGSIVAGHLVHRWGNRVLAAGALLALIANVELVWTLFWASSANGPSLYLGLILMGFGYGLLETPLLNSVLSKVPVDAAGMASGIVSTVRQVGTAFGVTFVGMAFTLALSQSYRAAFLCAVVYQIVALSVIAMCMIGKGVVPVRART